MSELTASLEDLQAFGRAPQSEKRVTPALRGILAEAALTGHCRYDWPAMQPLVIAQLDSVLTEYESEKEVGPSRLLLEGESSTEARDRLHTMLAAFPAAPFSYQRLAELLLEPRKQYSQLHKLVYALEKVLEVTSTISVAAAPKPRARLVELTGVNELPQVHRLMAI